MKNSELVEKFFNGATRGHTLNLYIEVDDLINYYTTLLHRDREKNILYYNITYYSSSTRKIQSYIEHELDYCNYKIIRYYSELGGNGYKDEKNIVKELAKYKINDYESLIINEFNEDNIIISKTFRKSQVNDIKKHIFGKKEKYIKHNKQKIYLSEFRSIEAE